MIKPQTEDPINRKSSHSKSSKEGLGILTEEIELALLWNRPSILIAIHNSKTGQIDTQHSLEREIIKKGKKVEYINIESTNPDVIRIMSEASNSSHTVFFVSGIENADIATNGKVYRALNLGRELLVEKHIWVVFWLSELEAANLPRLAPDFWAFRHRAVEFAPKHGTKKQSIPVGLFLWEEQIPCMGKNAQKEKLEYYAELLSQLPEETGSISTRIETTLRLLHYSWLLNDLKKANRYFEEGTDLIKKYPIPQYQAWLLNAKGIELYEEGNKEDASALFMQALSHDPDNSAITMNTCLAAYGLGKNKFAIVTGSQTVKKNPTNFHLWHILGYLYLSMGKIEDAIEAMTKAQAINPGNMDINHSLAVCYFKNEQHAKCINELSKAEQISPPQNAIQLACIGILNGNNENVLLQLKLSLENGTIENHQIMRDPNLHFLINPFEFLVTK